MNKYNFEKLEFYITNVCNLSCDGCNRFNNFKFSGSQNWSDYAQVYAEWSKFIQVDHIVILGGEPLLNPDIISWIYGLNQVFGTNVQILSNGTRINKVPGLYEALQVNGNWMGISGHNVNNLDQFDYEVRKFLKGQVTQYGKHDTQNNFGSDMLWIDENGVCIPLWMQYEFYASAIQISQAGRYILHNSDPTTAHNNCGFAIHKNYHFIKGKLYKCGPVALFPEFDQQHTLDVSDIDRQLLNSYQPLTAEGCAQHGSGYFDQLDLPLSQCKFCPESLKYKYRLQAVNKNLYKKQQNFESI